MATDGLWPCFYHHDGCEFTFDCDKDAQNHEKMCSYGFIACSQGCNDKIRRRDLIDHMKLTCPCRFDQCEFCKLEIMAKLLDDHKQKCLHRPATCKYCKIHKTIVKNLKAHQDCCPERPLPCCYAHIGCPFKEKEELRREHENDMIHHFRFFTKTVYEVKKDMDELKESIRDMNLTIRSNIAEIMQENNTNLFEKITSLLALTELAGKHEADEQEDKVNADDEDSKSDSSSDDENDNKKKEKDEPKEEEKAN